MELSFKEIISAFMVLFAVIDITGSIPIILDLKAKGNKISPMSAALGSLAVFIIFLFAGAAVLSLFGVDISSFAVAGSFVLFVLAIEMILGVELMKNDGPGGSATVVPVIFPLIAGAGTLTTLLSLRAEYQLENIIIAVILNIVVIYIVLVNLARIEKVLGRGLIYVLRKFFGIILLAIAVKLFASNVMQLFN